MNNLTIGQLRNLLATIERAGETQEQLSKDLDRLLTENEALRELILGAAPVAWTVCQDANAAWEWEMRAEKLLGAGNG